MISVITLKIAHSHHESCLAGWVTRLSPARPGFEPGNNEAWTQHPLYSKVRVILQIHVSQFNLDAQLLFQHCPKRAHDHREHNIINGGDSAVGSA